MSWNQAHAPLLVGAFQIHQEHDLKPLGSMDLITTKQTTFLHRQTCVACAIGPSVNPFSTNFSFQNLIFRKLFEFSAAEITQKSISPTF
jgi:hypothetical protein